MFALDFFFEVLFITSYVHLLFLYCCWGFIHSLWHNKWYLKLLYLFELNLCREPSCGQIHIWTDVKVAVAIICATGKSFGLSRQECRTVACACSHCFYDKPSAKTMFNLFYILRRYIFCSARHIFGYWGLAESGQKGAPCLRRPPWSRKKQKLWLQ